MNISEEEKELIINDYVENKICITKLAKKYHHNSRLITQILDENKIDHSRGVLRKGVSNIASMRVFTDQEKEIVKNIIQNGGTTKDCIIALHCGQDSLRQLLKELGLYLSHEEVIKKLPQNQRKYPVQDDYFAKPSHNMAYILGFLASDGTVRKDKNEIKLSLSSIDKEILEKMQKEIGGRPIQDYITQKGFSVSSWTLTSQKIKEDLQKYSIVPNKTFCLKPPILLPKVYWIDYIRGYFDGDGSINSLQNGKSLRWQICSATPEILEWIVNFLYTDYNIPKVSILSQKRKGVLYYFQYSTRATQEIYKILYTPNSFFLKRKKDYFQEIIRNKVPRDYASLE